MKPVDEEVRDDGATEEPGKDPKPIRGTKMKTQYVSLDDEVKVTNKVSVCEKPPPQRESAWMGLLEPWMAQAESREDPKCGAPEEYWGPRHVSCLF